MSIAPYIVQEYFQEVDRCIITPIMTKQEIPYASIEKLFSMYGLHDKFKDWIESNVEDISKLIEEIIELKSDLEGAEVELSDLKNDIQSELDDLEDAFKAGNPDEEVESCIRSINNLL